MNHKSLSFLAKEVRLYSHPYVEVFLPLDICDVEYRTTVLASSSPHEFLEENILP
jgi:hypothetical protein